MPGGGGTRKLVDDVRFLGRLAEIGRRARAYMDKGEYVPDSVTNAMVADRLAEDDAASGFLLDGYPRTTTDRKSVV